MNRCLILVDIQIDFLPGGALAVPRGDEVVPVANRIMDRFDWVIATQDWHPANHGSFAANHPGRCIGETVELAGQPQILWPVHCVQHTPGAEFAPELNLSAVGSVFQKGLDPDIDSYSGFYDNGRRRSTGLGEFLREQGVDRVYIMGLATDYCVKFTALDARSLGFETRLILDGCRGVDLSPGDSEAAIQALRSAGVGIDRSDDALAS